MIKIETFGFLDWWNEQTVELQQDWLRRHVDDSNRAVALANLKKGRRAPLEGGVA